MLKAIAGVALVLLIATVPACGGSGETTTVVEEDNAAQVEALQLEKEKAELEVEAAEAEAEKEKQEAKQAVAKAKAESEPVSDESPEPESQEASAPPNVVGLPLSTAEQQLSAAGYTTAPVNTDTLFGIVDEDNYTICKQNPPRGDVVKVLAQKYGC